MGRIGHKNDNVEPKTKKQKIWEEEGQLEEIDLESGMEKDTLSRDEGDDEQEAGPQPLKPWALIFIFLGLAILSAIICAVLWYFIHLDGRDGQDQNQLPELTSGVSAGMTSNPTDVSDPDSGLESSESSFESSMEGSDVTESDPNRITTTDGRVIIFQNCDDWVSPKEYVNLRTEPSTLQGDASVRCQLNYGEKVHRTGSSADSGWSRVEYNGELLYVVTSLMLEVSEE